MLKYTAKLDGEWTCQCPLSRQQKTACISLLSYWTCTQVQKTLGAKHVISVCSSSDSSKAMRALERLLANAETIRGMVNLSGAEDCISCRMCRSYKLKALKQEQEYNSCLAQ